MSFPDLRAACRRALGLALLWPVVVPAAHPLITEDTGTQGEGHFQFELTTEHATVKDAGSRQAVALNSAVLAYGATPHLDLLVSVQHLRLGATGTGRSEHGLADAGLDLKWRFYENGAMSMALKPGVTFPTGDAQRGLGVGKSTWSAYLVTSIDVQPWSFHLHIGHLHHNNTFNERVDLWHASAAVTRAFSESLKLVLDGGIDTNTRREDGSDPVFATLGLIWSPVRNFDIDAGYRIVQTDTIDARSWLAGLTWRF